MENANFEFLNSELAAKYFIDADVALRSGRHIQDFGNDQRIFHFIDEHYDNGLKEFYRIFCHMPLIRGMADNDKYYYLDYPDEGKGKLGKDNRSKELEDDKVIFGILLLNIFKDKFFEEKAVSWQDLELIFKEGENKESWQLLLFGKIKPNYTPSEEQSVKDKVRSILKDFERLGWIYFSNLDEMKFVIQPGIDRLVTLYGDVINNIDAIENYLKNEKLS
ncbi:chromosome partition protein MukE [Chryseosolibacter indicus]|uniref:Chromosome partition protein MukE n=1 Tax=Chryseosolibacter indicus TaxID=2782351 RepID=A0ABS5VYD6_9BACT|nr:chromosome partition protein MukE [Chryseosolibacter indicus]MBT1705875.1 chromosome partition protein MukE [Chryseosolibacter indicus]